LQARQYFEHHWGDAGTADLHKTFNEVTVLTSTCCLQGKEIREQVDEFTKLYWIMDKSLDSLSFFFPNVSRLLFCTLCLLISTSGAVSQPVSARPGAQAHRRHLQEDYRQAPPDAREA
jgi:hypothetical protein